MPAPHPPRDLYGLPALPPDRVVPQAAPALLAQAGSRAGRRRGRSPDRRSGRLPMDDYKPMGGPGLWWRVGLGAAGAAGVAGASAAVGSAAVRLLLGGL